MDTATFPSARDVLAAGEGTIYSAATLHVRVGGKMSCETAFGSLMPGGPPVVPDSKFDLASITKLFSGTTLLALIDDRRAALDDPLVSIIPEFGGQDPRRREVTLRHLLSHTSGLPAHVSFRDELGAAAVIARVCATPLVAPPGMEVNYSDLGFMLVGAAIERLTGGSLRDAIAAIVTEPMSSFSVGFNPARNDRRRIACTERDPWRGRLLQGEVHDENAWSMGGISGHAGLFGNASDVAILGELYRNGGAHGSIHVLTRHTARLATSEAASSDDERRGLAWALRSSAPQSCGSRFGPRSFAHTGYTGTSLWVDPDRELTVVLMTNRVYFTRDPQPIFDLRVAVHEAVIDDLDNG